MQTAPQEIITKLQKLLRLATDKGATQGEAEAAMAKAQELALRYKVELAGIQNADRPAEEYEQRVEKRSKTFQAKYVEWIVRRHFNVSMVYGHSGEVFIIGKPVDIEFAKFVMAYLEAEFPRLWNAYQKQTQCGQGERVNFFYGTWFGLDAALKENRERVLGEAIVEAEMSGDRSIASNFQLALVRDEQQLATAVSKFHPKLRKAKASTINVKYAGAIQAGRDAGRQIKIHRALGGRATSAGRLH